MSKILRLLIPKLVMAASISFALILTIVLTFGLPGTIKAQDTKVEKAKEQQEITTEPQADNMLKQMSDYLKTAKAFSYSADITFDDTIVTGQKLQYAAAMNVAMERPNHLYIEFTGDLGAQTFWYDGKTVTIHNIDGNIWSKVDVPDNIDDALNFIVEKYNFSIPLAELVYTDPYKVLTEVSKGGFYVGFNDAAGEMTHHLAYTTDLIDWQIWILDGEQVVPRKVVITYKDLPSSPQYSAILTDWDFAPRYPEQLFKANAPSDAVWVEMNEVKEENEMKNPDDKSGKTTDNE